MIHLRGSAINYALLFVTDIRGNLFCLKPCKYQMDIGVIIGIDNDTVCAGVVCAATPGTARVEPAVARPLTTGVRRYVHPTTSSPRGENIVTIFSPPLRYFHPLTISNGKSFCSQISLNFIMCIYNKEPFLYFLWLFTDFCSSQTVDTTH